MKSFVAALLLAIFLLNVHCQFEEDLDKLRDLLWETPVSEECLECMAKVINNKVCNEDGTCGVLAITKFYWVDGGRPTINNENPESPTAYENCARDPYCSSVATQEYMIKYKRDCNNDNVTNCHDYLRIHLLGAMNCMRTDPRIKNDTCDEK